MCDETTAANGRFGVMAAVAPQKRQYKFETLYPAATVVEAAPSPICRNVMCNRGRERSGTMKQKFER